MVSFKLLSLSLAALATTAQAAFIPSLHGRQNASLTCEYPTKIKCVKDGVEQCIPAEGDNDHCGDCDVVCDVATGGFCSGRVCACPSRKRRCRKGGDPKINDAGLYSCVDDQWDRANCGGCGVACEGACVRGKCMPVGGTDGNDAGYEHPDVEIPCDMAQTKCNGQCTYTISDKENCGACGVRCEGESECELGKCVGGGGGDGSDGPKPPKPPCDGVDLQTDDRNCGKCGLSCPPNTDCRAGQCVSCPPDQASCKMGGCVNLQNDNRNCGACDAICPNPHNCVNGVCV